MAIPRLADAGPPPVLHSPEGGARQLGISRAQMFKLLATGEVASVKIGRLRRIPHGSLVAYVERLQTEQGAA
ncbi:DNA-binding protein, excisionase family [Frankia sp. EI5c]|nr:DNA-binding protein, excisionase family [Frankia sp. EI5c]